MNERYSEMANEKLGGEYNISGKKHSEVGNIIFQKRETEKKIKM